MEFRRGGVGVAALWPCGGAYKVFTTQRRLADKDILECVKAVGARETALAAGRAADSFCQQPKAEEEGEREPRRPERTEGDGVAKARGHYRLPMSR